MVAGEKNVHLGPGWVSMSDKVELFGLRGRQDESPQCHLVMRLSAA